MAAESHELQRDFDLAVDSRDGGGTAIRVAGELDISSAPELDEALDEALTAGGEVTIDLEGCTFIDSTGISVIVRAARRLVEEGGRRLAVERINAQPQKVFQIAGLTTSGLIAVDELAG